MESSAGNGASIRIQRRTRKVELIIEGSLSQDEVSDLVLEIADLTQEGEFEGLASIRDDSENLPDDDEQASDRRLVLAVRRGADAGLLLYELVDRFPLEPRS